MCECVCQNHHQLPEIPRRLSRENKQTCWCIHEKENQTTKKRSRFCARMDACTEGIVLSPPLLLGHRSRLGAFFGESQVAKVPVRFASAPFSDNVGCAQGFGTEAQGVAGSVLAPKWRHQLDHLHRRLIRWGPLTTFAAALLGDHLAGPGAGAPSKRIACGGSSASWVGSHRRSSYASVSPRARDLQRRQARSNRGRP